MPVRNAIWKVGADLQPLTEDRLPSERTLEEMIVAAPSILSDEWMLIGRQEQTGTGGIIDLLAIAPDGTLVLIELKRARTPREVVAQALDYACWVEKLKAEDIAAAYGRFQPGRNLSDDFQSRFGYPLDEDTLNDSHQIVVVAASLDSSTERIVQYLNERDIPINVLFFRVFDNAGEQLLCRTWMIDPGATASSAAVAAPGTATPSTCSAPATASGSRRPAMASSASAKSPARASPSTSFRLRAAQRPRSSAPPATTASTPTIRTAASTLCR